MGERIAELIPERPAIAHTRPHGSKRSVGHTHSGPCTHTGRTSEAAHAGHTRGTTPEAAHAGHTHGAAAETAHAGLRGTTAESAHAESATAAAAESTHPPPGIPRRRIRPATAESTTAAAATASAATAASTAGRKGRGVTTPDRQDQGKSKDGQKSRFDNHGSALLPGSQRD